MRIYVAGPYTTGDTEANVAEAIRITNLLLDMGHTPFCPHLSHYLEAAQPRPYEQWMAWCMPWVDVCEVLYRMDGISPGGDDEVDRAKLNGIPVYFGDGGLNMLRLEAVDALRELIAKAVTPLDATK